MGRLQEQISLEQAKAHLEGLWPTIQKATVSPDWNALQQKQLLSYRLQMVSAATGAGWLFHPLAGEGLFCDKGVGPGRRKPWLTVPLLD